jgi:hypothetical protein
MGGISGEGDEIPLGENGLVLQLQRANLAAGDIEQNGEIGQSPLNKADGLGMPFEIAMGAIEAGDIHAGFGKSKERCGVVGGRSDGGDDLRFHGVIFPWFKGPAVCCSTGFNAHRFNGDYLD